LNALPSPVFLSGSFAGGVIGLLIVFALLGLAATVLWVITLINSAPTEQWVWFVLILVFGPRGFLGLPVGRLGLRQFT
jgi:hypothetical protein